ncbi:MAG: tetratricopeptide repeat protein [Prevotella sp.]|nr:tetratricopeptide repeat protein [Candidatus Prevotella equi]
MNKNILIITLFLLSMSVKAQTQQEWRDSLSTLSSLIERHPRNIDLRLRKAAVNIELEQYKYALEEYSKVLDLDPKNIAALYYRGFVNQQLGRYSFARNDYEAVLEQTPWDKHALMGLVLANNADGRKTQAYDGANRLITMFPKDADVYSIRAEVEQTMGMIDVALDDISKAIEIEEGSNKQSGKTTISMDDDIASYVLTSFSLYLSLGDKAKAKENLDYLVRHGIAKAQLNDYFLQVAGK